MLSLDYSVSLERLNHKLISSLQKLNVVKKREEFRMKLSSEYITIKYSQWRLCGLRFNVYLLKWCPVIHFQFVLYGPASPVKSSQGCTLCHTVNLMQVSVSCGLCYSVSHTHTHANTGSSACRFIFILNLFYLRRSGGHHDICCTDVPQSKQYVLN